ncbi:MAG: DNA polymerase III subunit delta [Bacilli bacterium]
MKKAKHKQPVHVVYGNEPFLIAQTVQGIKRDRLGKKYDDWQLHNFDCDEVSIEEVILEVETVSMFPGDKFVVAKNCSFLSSKSSSRIEHHLQALIQYITMPILENTLVLVVNDEKLDARKATYKSMQKNDYVALHECNRPKDHEIEGWLVERAKHYGVTVDPKARRVMIDYIGNHMNLLDNELQKLILYTEGQDITEADAKTLVAPSTDLVIFPLFSLLINNRREDVLRTYRQLIKNGENPLALLAFLMSQLRFYYDVGVYMKLGVPSGDIAKQVGRHPYAVKMAIGELRHCSVERIEQLRNLLSEAEIDMKMRYMPPVERLEHFILESFN